MPDDLSYWDWRDALLMHPEGRAKGGEPCVKCSEPVPANAHWKHRDRHVCGTRCNSNLGRQINRLIKNTGDLDLHGRELGAPAKMTNPRTSGPRIFRTINGQEPPFEWEGFGVRQGDLVERYGVLVGYALLSRATEEAWPNWWPDHVLIAMELRSRQQFICGATADWDLTRLQIGYFGPQGEPRNEATFTSGGQLLRWHWERIRDVTPDGQEFNWEALVAAPADSPYRGDWWSPARTALSEKRKRETSTKSRHARRVRLEDAVVERFDPEEIYERDGWVCQLCLRPVDRTLAWPHPESKSLDHVLPLVAGGNHCRANTQLAHWLCNVRKGARTT
ncbi:HNH endonuclease [Lentzea sp. NEAU-D7]|uniref:HNH endonuclease n=1 Tax=Lentzea sp. NEAU-D7 TaxID=2994667 RepID=UPI00224B5CFF|nr:HNH endonuclease [Lentzea sp. NEAU-D7]MCX2950199.1 HNH endonuclease [Lentzea sp. NEAU-D7]